LTILTPKGKTLKQLYLGKNLYKKKARILKRKSKLQSYADRGDPKARERLRKLNNKVSNMTKNAVGELSKEIHNIAEKYESKIVMERLTRFPTNKGKKANRKISLIPFMLLRQRVIVRSVDTENPLGYVHPYHTSKWCPSCGSVNPAHNKNNYAIYRCTNCGFECNSDRKASLTIALKKFVGRDQKWFQYPTKRVPVNALFWGNDGDYGKGTEIPAQSSDPKVVL
jgi:IS605 OrfB family transposase